MDQPLDVRVLLTPEERRRRLLEDVRAGLLSTGEKRLSPVWFYDERGSELFEQITRLPEYYPTRAERSILADHHGEVAKLAAADTLVELGSGTSDKTLLLLDAMAPLGLRRFVPLDVSEASLRAAAGAVRKRYGVEVVGVVGDFHDHLETIPREGRRLVAFLGGTIGNLRAAERARFLSALRSTLDEGDALLLGTDLVKDTGRLVAAYDDAAGVTAAFNRNVLSVLARELAADFEPAEFDHVARWNPDEAWIEMRLRARRPQQVRIGALGASVAFAEGEELLTEISAKFTREQLAGELEAAGLTPVESWTDAGGDFLVTLSRPA